jgi:hypothetical protein
MKVITEESKTEADEYFQRFFDEKENITEFSYITVTDEHVWDFNYTKDDMVKILQSFDDETKDKIRNILVKIDFNNGDINHFLEYIFLGYAKTQMGEKLDDN